MTTAVEAIYEHGVFRPVNPLELPLGLQEGAKVELILVTSAVAQRTPAEILSAIAALPTEAARETDDAAREHDHYLYGKSKTQEQP